MTLCQRCAQAIEWGRLATGAYVALDLDPDPAGTYALLSGGRALPVSPELRAQLSAAEVATLHRYHHDHCAGAGQFLDLAGAYQDTGWRRRQESARAHRIAFDRSRPTA